MVYFVLLLAYHYGAIQSHTTPSAAVVQNSDPRCSPQPHVGTGVQSRDTRWGDGAGRGGSRSPFPWE